MTRIAVVEDDLDLREIFTIIFSDEGYEVVQFKNGYEAFEYLQFNSVDLLLIDYMMPIWNGQRLIEELKEQENLTPIIVTSAHLPAPQVVRKYSLGYLKKPFAIDDLTTIVGETLKNHRI